MIALVIKSDEFCVETLKLTPDRNGKFKPTTLALASVIMALYNIFAWVEFNQNMNKSTQFNELD